MDIKINVLLKPNSNKGKRKRKTESEKPVRELKNIGCWGMITKERNVATETRVKEKTRTRTTKAIYPRHRMWHWHCGCTRFVRIHDPTFRMLYRVARSFYVTQIARGIDFISMPDTWKIRIITKLYL